MFEWHIHSIPYPDYDTIFKNILISVIEIEILFIVYCHLTNNLGVYYVPRRFEIWHNLCSIFFVAVALRSPVFEAGFEATVMLLSRKDPFPLMLFPNITITFLRP